jgi:hypothetical protein
MLGLKNLNLGSGEKELERLKKENDERVQTLEMCDVEFAREVLLPPAEIGWGNA